MMAMDANWLIYGGIAVVALLIACWLYARASTAPRRREYKPDVLSEGAAPAQRNQALIDAPPAAQIVTPAPHGAMMAGVAEIVAVTAQDEVEEVEARAAEMEVVPEVEEAPAPVAAAAAGDDLAKIKGLGPKLQKLLPELGLSTYAQIAALTDADLDALDAKLGAFAGRPRRDAWVEQARLLASGDVSGFEGKFGKL